MSPRCFWKSLRFGDRPYRKVKESQEFCETPLWILKNRKARVSLIKSFNRVKIQNTCYSKTSKNVLFFMRFANTGILALSIYQFLHISKILYRYTTDIIGILISNNIRSILILMPPRKNMTLLKEKSQSCRWLYLIQWSWRSFGRWPRKGKGLEWTRLKTSNIRGIH